MKTVQLQAEPRTKPRTDIGGYADEMMHVGEGERSPHMRILGRMTALGMVSGRGIPIRFVA